GYNHTFLNPRVYNDLPPLYCLEDLALHIAISRPAPLHNREMIDVDCKQTENTHGILIYQEQGVEIIKEQLRLNTKDALILFKKFQSQRSSEEITEITKNNPLLSHLQSISACLFSKAYALSQARILAMDLSLHHLLTK